MMITMITLITMITIRKQVHHVPYIHGSRCGQRLRLLIFDNTDDDESFDDYDDDCYDDYDDDDKEAGVVKGLHLLICAALHHSLCQAAQLFAIVTIFIITIFITIAIVIFIIGLIIIFIIVIFIISINMLTPASIYLLPSGGESQRPACLIYSRAN